MGRRGWSEEDYRWGFKGQPEKKYKHGKRGRYCSALKTTYRLTEFPFNIKHRDHLTYIIEAEGSGLVKIGRSKNFNARFAALKRQSAVKLKVLRVIKDLDHEKRLHANLAQFRDHGEWFRKTPELVAYLNNYFRNDPYFFYIY